MKNSTNLSEVITKVIIVPLILGHPKTVDQFGYEDTDINDIIYDCMGKSSFMGVSGHVHFPGGGDPDRMVQIERIQGNSHIHIRI